MAPCSPPEAAEEGQTRGTTSSSSSSVRDPGLHYCTVLYCTVLNCIPQRAVLFCWVYTVLFCGMYTTVLWCQEVCTQGSTA